MGAFMENIIKKELFGMQDLKYRDFHKKLIPGVDPDRIIGIRTPDLSKFAKKIKNEACAQSFLTELPHTFYEENNLHGFLIEQIRDYDRCIDELNRFLPYIDNWATCDGIRPKCFGKNTDRLYMEIEKWLSDSHTYTVRFGIEMLMTFYLDEKYDRKYPERVSRIISSEYYVNMMIAWYFATALAKQWESIIPFLEENQLPVWVHNKTIQKAVESYRITEEQKLYLRSLKRK